MESSRDPAASEATTPVTAAETAPDLDAGAKVGRFVVLERLGEGGMGVVLSAYDPVLDRNVALKLLRRDLTKTENGTEARERLKREAQAMARLRHPNVVTLHEVGEHEGRIFLAMENVPGGTLGEWADEQRDRPGGWKKILDGYVQAGRGLVAAHEQGLIHRDFKPSNVVVDGDRFQVADFGISSVADPNDAVHPASSESAPDLTRAGSLLGTVSYMAPERHRGEKATEATDQFAFCVSLYESLFGHRPFRGKTTGAVTQAILDDTPEAPPASTAVPQYVRAAIMRGLSKEPGARWPSMAALLRTLATPYEARVGRTGSVIAGVAVGLGFVALPVLGIEYGIPFDVSDYPGVVLQTSVALAFVLALGWWGRNAIGATERYRKAIATPIALLVLQIPFELGCAALGVDLGHAQILHLFYWATIATMYAVLAEREFLVLGGWYLLAFALAVARPAYVGWIASIANIGLVLTIVYVNLVAREHAERTGSP